jgi:hypothetical protein
MEVIMIILLDKVMERNCSQAMQTDLGTFLPDMSKTVRINPFISNPDSFQEDVPKVEGVFLSGRLFFGGI